MKEPKTPQEKANNFYEEMETLAAKYDVATMKADDGFFEISIYTESGLETFKFMPGHAVNR